MLSLPTNFSFFLFILPSRIDVPKVHPNKREREGGGIIQIQNKV